jgi:hypothetical protein
MHVDPTYLNIAVHREPLFKWLEAIVYILYYL